MIMIIIIPASPSAATTTFANVQFEHTRRFCNKTKATWLVVKRAVISRCLRFPINRNSKPSILERQLVLLLMINNNNNKNYDIATKTRRRRRLCVAVGVFSSRSAKALQRLQHPGVLFGQASDMRESPSQNQVFFFQQRQEE
jgi:hypothetical protein